MLITAGPALEIIREVSGREAKDKTVLKRWADQGRITRVAVHSKCALYEESEIREAAKSFGKPRATLGKPVGLSVVNLENPAFSV